MRIGWMAGVAVLVFMVVTAMAGQDRGTQNLVLEGGSRGEVPFPHWSHQDALKDCNACHDLFGQKAGALEKAKQDGTLANKQVMNEKCVACHKTTKAAGKKTGPLKCSECHQKK